MALTEKQLAERQNYIGGSEVGSILGLNPFESPLTVFNKKIEGGENISNSHTYWGNVLEPTIRNEFDKLLRKHSDMWIHDINETKYHKKEAYNFLAANVDGLICTNPLSTKKAILEIKTCLSTNQRKHWGEENHDLICLNNRIDVNKSFGLNAEHGKIPNSYYCQCAHYMSIYDLPVTYLVVFFGNDMPFKVYKIERDLEFEKEMIESLYDFWHNNVLKGIPPKPKTLDDVIKLYPKAKKDKIIIAENDIIEKSFLYKELKEKEKNAKKEANEIKKDLKFFMKDSEIMLDFSGHKLHSWSRFEKKKFQLDLLEKEMPEVYRKYLTKVDSERFI
jgi:putative phage-type endonuclease